MGRMGVILFVLLGGFLGGRLTSPATPPEIKTVEVPAECPIAAPPVKSEAAEVTGKALNTCLEALNQMSEKITNLQQDKQDWILDIAKERAESEMWRQKYIGYQCSSGSDD